MCSPLLANRFRRALLALATVTVTQWGTVDARAESWLFDFGGTGFLTSNASTTGNDPSRFWNNITDTIGTTNTGTLLNLVTTTNAVTPVDFAMVSRFAGTNNNGPTNSTIYPSNATRDSLFGNTGIFQTLSNITPIFKLTSLDPLLSYTFKFFAGRSPASDNRETLYTLEGSVSGSATLNASNNVNGFTTVSGITPTLEGEITISLTPGPNNNNNTGDNSAEPSRFIYLGVMEMESVPEPTAAVAIGAGMIALATRRRRSS